MSRSSLSAWRLASLVALGLLTASSGSSSPSTKPSHTGPRPYAPSCNVRSDYGAAGDGVTFDTVAVAAALADDACGAVVLDGGKFRVDKLHMPFHRRLVISPGAELRIGGGQVASDPHEDLHVREGEEVEDKSFLRERQAPVEVARRGLRGRGL